MNRKHNIEDYLDLIKNLKKLIQQSGFQVILLLVTQVKQKKILKKLLKLLKEVKFINTYSFIFSPRPGTPAAKMKKIDDSVSKKKD